MEATDPQKAAIMSSYPQPETAFVGVARKCLDCGGRRAIAAFFAPPTADEEWEVRHALGGTFCIESWTVEVPLDGDIVLSDSADA